MVVLLVAAITTATYAWFTTSASVSVGSSTLTAAKTNAVNVGIGGTKKIASDDGGFVTMPASMVGLEPIDGIFPMMPAAKYVPGTTTLSQFLMTTASITDGGTKFAGVKHDNAPQVFTNADDDWGLGGAGISDSIFLAVGPTTSTSTQLTVSVGAVTGKETGLSGDALTNQNQLVAAARVAVFAIICDHGDAPSGAGSCKESSTTCVPVLVGIWANGTGTVVGYGSPANGSDPAAMDTNNDLIATTTGSPLDLPVLTGAIGNTGKFIRVQVIAWFEGKVQVERHADYGIAFDLAFALKT